MPSVPAAVGQQERARTAGRHGAPGGASASKPASFAAAHVATSTVSARVSVHTA